jgi:quercetin dioxygenase-like cupin family protein
MDDVVTGNGWAAASLDALGDGPGFRKIRTPLGVTAFGMNAIVLPAGYGSGFHFHDEQEETYFVHDGEVEFQLGDGDKQVLGAGGLLRVDPETVRGYRNVGEGEATILCIGGKDGYVGRDGRLPEGETGRVRTPEQ